MLTPQICNLSSTHLCSVHNKNLACHDVSIHHGACTDFRICQLIGLLGFIYKKVYCDRSVSNLTGWAFLWYEELTTVSGHCRLVLTCDCYVGMLCLNATTDCSHKFNLLRFRIWSKLQNRDISDMSDEELLVESQPLSRVAVVSLRSHVVIKRTW